jgi:hypothetical protein
VVKRFAPMLLAAVAVVLAPADARAAVGIVRAQALLPAGPHRFGEQLSAELDVLVNRKLADPGTVRASTHFGPYELVRAPRRDELGEGPVVRVRFRYTLQCTSLACTISPKLERRFAFGRVVVEYRDSKGSVRSTKVSWPAIVVVTRVRDDRYRPQTATQARQQIPLDPLLQLPASVKAPEPSYRVRPLALAFVLLAAALLALLAAAFAARPLVALLRRADAEEGPPLSPLEQAVVAVETATQRQPGSAEHREALALLARQLRRASLSELVNRSRKLAWSEQAPSASASRSLTTDVRARMGGDA